jgi:bifunctional DNA-binding transcriptional regulator/antitoxin component of YhaV-PrlF toxin-antitoxin module
MTLGKTTRLKKHDNVYEIEIPKELVNKLQWMPGFVLEINEDKDKLVVEKLPGFMGS